MTISGGRTKQLDIFCHVTGFMSDFLSFIVVEHIQFFHGALQLQYTLSNNQQQRVLQDIPKETKTIININWLETLVNGQF